MASLATTIVLRVGDAEAEYAGTISYERHKAYDGGRVCPSEPAHCEITGITLDFTATRRIDLDELVVAELAGDLEPALMEAWTDEIADAAERRAEQRRDDLMMERF